MRYKGDSNDSNDSIFLKVGKGNQGVITAAQILLEKYRR